MVAYTFKSGFVEPIVALEKRQTIRIPRRNPTRVGQALQFFTGARFNPTRIGAARCVAVREVRLDFAANVVELDGGIRIETEGELNSFAIRDGFSTHKYLASGLNLSPWRYMERWWALTHPDHKVFSGVLIDGDDTFVREPRS